jgi:hypothetical protein
MSEHIFKPTRRDILKFSAAGLAGAPFVIEDRPPQPVQDSYYQEVYDRMLRQGVKPDARGAIRLALSARYLTDAERINRMLHPPFTPDDRPEVLLCWFLILSPPASGNIFVPGWTYGEADLFVSCKYKGHRCMTALSFPLDQDFGRYAGRQNILMRKKEGRVMIDFDGKSVRAWTTRRGKLLSAIETEMTDAPGHPYFGHREVGWGWMRCDYRLHPDWTRGPLFEGDVQLWRIFGYDDGYPSEMPEQRFHPRLPRAGDLRKTRIWLGEPDPLEPWGEFPVREILGVNFSRRAQSAEGTVSEEERLAIPRGPQKKPVRFEQRNNRTFLENLDKEAMQEWAFFAKGYDRPITRNKVWLPAGFPHKTTAVKVTRDELKAWRARRAMELNPADLVDIRLALDATKHARTLPPPLAPGNSPQARIVAARAEASDYSTLPFTEFWLMSRCEFAGKPAWFTLSHIVSWEGDVFFGRENYGYPSKHGEPRMTVDPMQIDLVGRRLHRDFFYATLPLSLDAPKTYQDDLTAVGIRVISPATGKAYSNYITQPWTIQINQARTVWPGDAHLVFPTVPGPGNIGKPDPWFDFQDAKVVSCIAGRGAIRRFPGQTHGAFELAKYRKFLQDRDEGQFDGARAPSTATFLVGETGANAASRE